LADYANLYRINFPFLCIFQLTGIPPLVATEAARLLIGQLHLQVDE